MSPYNMIGESVPRRLVDELNRRISTVNFNKVLSNDGDRDIVVSDITTHIEGNVPADITLHVEFLFKGYEHTLFSEDVHISRLSRRPMKKSESFREIHHVVQSEIDKFVSELAECVTRGAYGRAIIPDSFCAN